ncbi:MAG: hypothetical protein LBD61_02550 [Endomicrobium sp.]|nr:hypothetical protein [Endomicrobium sp.]
MKYINSIIFISIICFLNGCFSKFSYYESISHGEVLSKQNSIEIGKDIAEFLEPFYAPAQTTFLIMPYKNMETNFLFGIEENLRLYGYAITRDNQSQAIPFAYKAQYMDDNKTLIIILNIELARISRLYDFDNDKNVFIPISSFTAQNLPSPTIIPDIEPPKTIIPKDR